MSVLTPTPHPMLPWPFSDEDVVRAEHNPELLTTIVDLYNERERRIQLAETDPFAYVFEPPAWAMIDKWVEQRDLVAIFGANRTTKSHYAARRIVQAAVRCQRSVFLCLGEGEKQAIATQHQMIWDYLPLEWKALNGKRNSIFKINWSQAGGFTEGKMVLPNRSEVYFATYNMEPGVFEGWEFGSKDQPVIAVWPDESMPVAWLDMLSRRMKFRSAKMAWTFTPVRGITPAIKKLLGSAPKVLESAPAELLPNAKLPGCERGHMPVVVQPQMEPDRSIAIYLHLGANPFGNYTAQIKGVCKGKTQEYIERVAYGYARDLRGRAFPKFGSWNIVDPTQLPAKGANYHFVDPAGNRNWSTIWVRVTDENPSKIYIYRDWPDAKHYGEWAVPTERQVDDRSTRGWDGDQGPAQLTLGFGTVRYKQLFLELERVSANESDPYRLSCRKQDRDGKEIGQELIVLRYIDPRAASDERTAEHGGTCITNQMSDNQLDSEGKVIGPSMPFTPASGVHEDRGITVINDLLEWENEELMDPVMNSPRLFVSSDCEQVIWALSNYTGMGGPKGACKDFVDLVRYMALADLQFVTPSMLASKGGGGY